MKNKLAHTLILLVFGIACRWLWNFLGSVAGAGGGRLLLTGLPLRPLVVVLPVLAAAYCL